MNVILKKTEIERLEKLHVIEVKDKFVSSVKNLLGVTELNSIKNFTMVEFKDMEVCLYQDDEKIKLSTQDKLYLYSIKSYKGKRNRVFITIFNNKIYKLITNPLVIINYTELEKSYLNSFGSDNSHFNNSYELSLREIDNYSLNQYIELSEVYDDYEEEIYSFDDLAMETYYGGYRALEREDIIISNYGLFFCESSFLNLKNKMCGKEILIFENKTDDLELDTCNSELLGKKIYKSRLLGNVIDYVEVKYIADIGSFKEIAILSDKIISYNKVDIEYEKKELEKSRLREIKKLEIERIEKERIKNGEYDEIPF